MYTFSSNVPGFENANIEAKQLAAEIVAALPVRCSGYVIAAGTTLPAEPLQSGSLYLLKEGSLVCRYRDQRLFYYDEGDLVGAGLACAELPLEVFAEFAVAADRYSSADVFTHAVTAPALHQKWTQFIGVRFKQLTLLLAGALKEDSAVETQVRQYQPGDVIIRQGEAASEVFTMMQGHADVFVDQHKVGTIGTDEMFGVLSVLTNTVRTASVVAASACTVIALPAPRFSELITRQPLMVLQLLKEMANTIVALNEHVVQLANWRPQT